MNKKSAYRLDVCLLHFAIYFAILMMPWLFTFEILPITYANIPVTVEIVLYFLWSIILILGVIAIRKDIRNITTGWSDASISKRMWKLIFNITWYFMLITLAYLLLCLILIAISFLV